ncbi:hypothetical protein L3Q82_002733 [Scortum barcoo]|uniref:Uncharacterized protein n=1 Tax=Scortum barcoo TaxID=214431 RepID=A0ACB8VUN1_9TELE|nr:hypothetical protein L3Q82_002733 [Scortum barcoo]
MKAKNVTHSQARARKRCHANLKCNTAWWEFSRKPAHICTEFASAGCLESGHSAMVTYSKFDSAMSSSLLDSNMRLSHRYKTFTSKTQYQMVLVTLHKLQESGFYWGAITGKEANAMLAAEATGTFLIRDSSDNRHLFALSVKTASGTKNLRIQCDAASFYLQTDPKNIQAVPRFDCVLKLVHYYMSQSKGNTRAGSTYYIFSGGEKIPLELLKPLSCNLSTLQHLCRKTVNGHLDISSKRDQLPHPLREFLQDAVGVQGTCSLTTNANPGVVTGTTPEDLLYDSVVASAIFYGIVCWASSITDRDRRRMDRLVRRASSVLGCLLDSVEVVRNGRMMAKPSSMLNNTSHPLQDTLGSSFRQERCPRKNEWLPWRCPQKTLRSLTSQETAAHGECSRSSACRFHGNAAEKNSCCASKWRSKYKEMMYEDSVLSTTIIKTTYKDYNKEILLKQIKMRSMASSRPIPLPLVFTEQGTGLINFQVVPSASESVISLKCKLHLNFGSEKFKSGKAKISAMFKDTKGASINEHHVELSL